MMGVLMPVGMLFLIFFLNVTVAFALMGASLTYFIFINK